MRLYMLGLRTSIRNNASAYGFSIMISCTLLAAQTNASPVTAPRILAFAAAAAVTFAAIEAVASDFFRIRERQEPAEVVVLGSALSLVSITAGIAAALGVGWWLTGWTVWPAMAAASTAVYLMVVGLEMALARRAEGDDG